MIKPVILVVDDDASVREALAIELATAFGEVCAIEPATGADDVVALLATWTEERRAVAVAVVDQKLPGTSGVELLERLRRDVENQADETFHPWRYARALLLTGYAGLDSAVAAKNRAKVDAFLEKPWRSASLRCAVRYLCRGAIGAGGFDQHYVFRPVETAEDMRAVLELRYLVYSLSPENASLTEGIADGLEADPYDRISFHFLLEGRSLTANHAVGTLRITPPELVLGCEALEDLAASEPGVQARTNRPREWPLPMLEYLVDRDAVLALLREFAGRGEVVAEAGRFSVHPDFRRLGVGVDLKHLARHIVDSAVAYFFFFRIDNAMLTCVRLHTAFYRPYGFRDADGTSPKFQPALGCEKHCLHGRPDWVPERKRTLAESMARRVARKGLTCRCESFPACLPEPYETEDFRGTDVFCPLRASEMLDAEKQDATIGRS